MRYPSEDYVFEIVSQIREAVDFYEIASINKPYSDDIGIALPQVDSRSLKLQMVGYPIFVREWFRVFEGPGRLYCDEMVPLINKILDWRSANMITFVCRKHLRNETPISWRHVAEKAYDSRKNSFPKLISEKMKSSGEAFTRLGVFEIETSFRMVNGLPEVGRYFVSAGFTLSAFEKYIWRDLRKIQLQKFADQHL